MVKLHTQDPNLLSRILDVAQDLKVRLPSVLNIFMTSMLTIKALPSILDNRNFSFVIDLAALAARREYLNLEKWLQDSIAKHRDDFITVALEFLQHKLIQSNRGDANQTLPSIPLSEEAVTAFISALQNNAR